MAWLTLHARSVSPATLMHAAGNAAVCFVGDPLTGETGNTAWFAGETGFVLALAYCLVAAGWWRFTRGEATTPRPPAIA